MENIQKLIISKPMKHNKNGDTLLFEMSFINSQRGNNIDRTFCVSAGAQKGWATAGSGSTLPQYLPNPITKFPVKFIFTSSIFVLLPNGKEAKAISLKVFKIMVFKIRK